MRNPESNLLVVEYGGTARSGKGTIVNHLGKTREGVATDETGADYRALTRTLLHEAIIERGMPREAIELQLARISLGYLTDTVAQRHDIVQHFGNASLYDNDVNETVSMVGAVESVRKAVKSGFRQRVETVRDNSAIDILVVDGRNLASVIETIPDTQLILRTFVSCSALEAGWRECARQGIDLKSAQGTTIVNAIKQRNDNDALRTLDPVRPDKDALDYWHDLDVLRQTLQDYADTQFNGDFNRAVDEIFINQQEKHTRILRIGAGALASSQGRQIHLDTGFFRGNFDNPREAMLDATDQMFDEALEFARRPLKLGR